MSRVSRFFLAAMAVSAVLVTAVTVYGIITAPAGRGIPVDRGAEWPFLVALVSGLAVVGFLVCWGVSFSLDQRRSLVEESTETGCYD